MTAHFLGMPTKIQLKFGIEGSLPWENLCVFLLREYPTENTWKWHFLYFWVNVKYTCTCLSGFLGLHSTPPCVLTCEIDALYTQKGWRYSNRATKASKYPKILQKRGSYKKFSVRTFDWMKGYVNIMSAKFTWSIYSLMVLLYSNPTQKWSLCPFSPLHFKRSTC